MNLLIATLFNALAIVGPVVGLATVFGLQETVQADSPKHLLALLAVALFSFVSGTIGMRIATRDRLSVFDAITISLTSSKDSRQ